MSSYKYIICLVVLVATLLAVNTEPISEVYNSDALAEKSHNLVVGSRTPGDRLLYKETVIKDSSWMRIVTVEKTYHLQPRERVTMVEALDQKTNGNGAYPSVLNGGPGHNNVTIKLKSQRSHGINFVIQLYGF